MPRREKPQTALIRECLSLLHARGVVAWRQNIGAAVVNDKAGGKRFVRFGARGVSDILGCLPGGRFLAVECKTARDRLSEAQILFLDSVTRAGGLALVIRDAAELDNALRSVQPSRT